jgi:hypothetical protein
VRQRRRRVSAVTFPDAAGSAASTLFSSAGDTFHRCPSSVMTVTDSG